MISQRHVLGSAAPSPGALLRAAGFGPHCWLLPSLTPGARSGYARAGDKEPLANHHIPMRSRSGARGAGETAKALPRLCARSGLSHIPCACSSADVPTPSLARGVSVWSVQTFLGFFWWLLCFFNYYFYFGEKKITPGDARVMSRCFFPPHVPNNSSSTCLKTSRVPSDFTCISYSWSGSPWSKS